MQRSRFERFIEQLRAYRMPPADPFVVPAERYRSQAVLDRELALFGTRIVAHASELAGDLKQRDMKVDGRVGACLPIDLAGADGARATLLTRDAGGVVHAFANACRHRGTRLVDAPCAAKAITCPYHAWTYDLAGRLLHVPHREAFAFDERNLLERPVAERHGLIWLGPDAATHARELDDDLAALALDEHVLYKRARTQRRCNWKLVIEAFLDGYHIRVLHRDSIYRFFLDGISVAERAGPHIRAVTARRALNEDVDLRLRATPSFVVFPSTVIIAHPDFVSVLTVYPLAPNLTDWDHMMLIPRARAGETEHWAKSWQLIEETVFQREDLWICEQIQRTIDDGATDELMFGALEEPVRWFHAAIEAG